MFNLRYHIASLVAVFLALAVGLVLGSVVVERGVLDRQRASIVQGLQAEYGRLGEENQELQADVERLRSYVRVSAPTLLGEPLTGRRVLVLANAGPVEGLSAVRTAIGEAGGEAHVVTAHAVDLGVGTSAVDSAASALVGSWESTSTGVSLVVEGLVREWGSVRTARPLTEALRSAGVLRMSSLPPSRRVDGVVVLAAHDGVPDAAAIAIAAGLARLGIPAVGVEAEVSTGVASAAARAGMSAVDGVEDPENALLLVRILEGAISGYYGTGDGADGDFPAFD